MKVTKQEQKEHAQLKEALSTHSKRVALEFDALLTTLTESTKSVNAAIKARNEVAKRVVAFAEQVAERLRDEFDEKSERWQESDAGQEALSLVEQWENINVDEIEEVKIVTPELEGDASADFDDLPFEPE